MPRVYKPSTKKQYKKYDEKEIAKALKELEKPNAKLNEVAKKYDIHKSVLYRHSTRKMKKHGGQTALSDETEALLIENIIKCAEWGYPMDTMDLRYIIKMYLDKLGVKNKKFKNNLPGPDFVYGFLKRNKDKVANRIVENIKRARAEVSPDTIKKYFEELKKSLEGVPPANIINYDETNLTDDPGRTKALVRRGSKYPERKLDSTKASVSIMMAGTAEGELLPPYVVYKAKHLYDTWVEIFPEGTRYNRSSSGWFEGVIFEDWVLNIVIPHFQKIPGKKILIGDNLSSHISVDLIQYCKEHHIDFVFLPANSTHLTQPLDVAFFRPMKIAWRKLLLLWKKTDGRNLPTIPKGCFPKLLKRLLEEIKINSKNNLLSGFRKTGIFPLDANAVLERLPSEPPSEHENQRALEDTVLELLKNMRYGSMDITENSRKRKLNIVSGRSISAETINEAQEIRTTTAKKTKNVKACKDSVASGLLLKNQSETLNSTPTHTVKKVTTSITSVPTGLLLQNKPGTLDSTPTDKVKKVTTSITPVPSGLLLKTKPGSSGITPTDKEKKVTTSTGFVAAGLLLENELGTSDSTPTDKEKKVTETSTKAYKGKGIGKMTKNNKKDNDLISGENKYKPLSLLHDLDIESMPMFVIDDIAGEEVIIETSDRDNMAVEEMMIESDKNKENIAESTCSQQVESGKVKIISTETFKTTANRKKVLLNNCKKVSLQNYIMLPKTTLNTTHAKPPKKPRSSNVHCYKNKEDMVLKILMEEDSE